MKPSDVILTTPPLTGTFGRSEREHAAALLVRCCQVNDDKWAAFNPRELGNAIETDLDADVEPVASWKRNPFINPDFCDLVSMGFAVIGEDNRIGFSEKGLKALIRWAKPNGE